MRTLAFFATVGLALAAAPGNVGVIGQASATQAKIGWTTAYSGTCVAIVSESATLTPIINDLNTAYWPSVNSDPDSRLVHRLIGSTYYAEFLVGHRTAPTAAGTYGIKGRALAAGTPHYGSITCAGETTLFSFTTAQLSGLNPEPPLWNADGHGNTAVESFDFADRTKPIIDPQTGAKVYRVTDSTDRGFALAGTFPASSVTGGSGWTNPQNLVNSSKATTGNTNIAAAPFMPAANSLTFAGFSISQSVYMFQLANMGITLVGSATNTSGDNAIVQVCLSVDGGQTCLTDWIDITLTGSTTTVGPFPTTYALNGFQGWSKTIPAELRMSQGYVTVSGSNVTIVASLDNKATTNIYMSASWARPEWAAGMPIYIAGSAAIGCTNDFCTLASVTDRLHFTIVESGTIGTAALYRSLGFRAMFRKKTATGTVTFQATYNTTAYTPLTQGQAPACNQNEVIRTSDSKPGHLCALNEMRDSFPALYFVANEPGIFAPLSQLASPSSIPGYGTNDLPRDAGFRAGPTVVGLAAHPTNGNKFFTVQRTLASGQPAALFDLTYSGNYATPSGFANSYSVGGAINGFTDPVTWANLTRKVPNGPGNLSDQILASTNYGTSLLPSLAALRLVGLTSSYATMDINPVQGTPSPLFSFDAATGLFSSYFNTLQTAAGFRFGGIHNTTPVPGSADQSPTSYDQLNVNFNTIYGGGAFVTPIDCVYKSSVCAANTSLPGTVGSGFGYDSTCPADIPQAYKDMGATGDQCVTVQVIGEPCSATPTDLELADYPCPNPTSSTKSWIGSQTDLGDTMTDSTGDTDVEWMTLVKKTATTATPCASGGRCELVLARDFSTGYNCVDQGGENCTRGRKGVGSVTQAAHSNGWTGRWISSSELPVYNPATRIFSRDNRWLNRGHGDRSYSVTAGNTYVGIYGQGGYFARLNGQIGGPASAYLAQWPGFAGILSSAGGASGWMQSYISTPGGSAAGINTLVGSDWRIVNDGGCEAEQPAQLVSPFACNIGGVMAYSLQGGTTSVYRICLTNCASPGTGGINGTYNAKKNSITGWAGAYGFKEYSGPTALLSDSRPWEVCHVLNDGECFAGSTAGELYAVIPKLETGITRCNEGQISYRNACFFATGPVLGRVMQMSFTNDPEGVYQRAVGQNLTRPGAMYSYSHARTLPDGKCILSTAYQVYGWWSGAVQICPGPMIQDSVNRTTFQAINVQGAFASGYVEFGYDSNFYCTSRSEACRVAASAISSSVPFYFATESGITPVTGAATIAVPALPGRVLFYRTVNNGVPGATRTVVVP